MYVITLDFYYLMGISIFKNYNFLQIIIFENYYLILLN